MLEKVKKEITEFTKNFDFERKKFKILVSISGGQDSLLLIKIFNKISIGCKNKIIIEYIYVDHQWKKNSYKQIEHISNYIKSLKSKVIIYQINKSSLSEKECRIQRYHIINDHAIRNDHNLIITGHHLNDKIETFFQNIGRGSGLEGLSSPIISNHINKKTFTGKPLLNVDNNNIYWLCKKLFLPIWSDSTNYIYSIERNRIRHELIPYLSIFLNQKIRKNIINLTKNYYYENEYIKQNVHKLYIQNIHNSKIAINYKNIIKQHLVLQIRTIQVFCLHNFQTYFNNKKIVRIINSINTNDIKKKS